MFGKTHSDKTCSTRHRATTPACFYVVETATKLPIETFNDVCPSQALAGVGVHVEENECRFKVITNDSSEVRMLWRPSCHKGGCTLT